MFINIDHLLNMANKLYPSLEEFYKNNNIDNGDEDIWYSVSDQKLYRTQKRAKNYKDITDNILFTQKTVTDEDYETQCIPSAPPLEEISWDDLKDIECYPDYSLIRDHSLPPPYTDHDPLLNNNSWIDELQPDYDDDCSSSQADQEYINISANVINNNAPMDSFSHCHQNRLTESAPKTDNNPRASRNDRPSKLVALSGRDGDKKFHANAGKPIGNKARRNSDDYTAWVAWRKQVNRQLASLILLRRGDHVRLQTVDLSRKPLSKTSMKEVLQRATYDCSPEAMTSLNGKPYIMYGIPRVALPKSPMTQ